MINTDETKINYFIDQGLAASLRSGRVGWIQTSAKHKPVL